MRSHLQLVWDVMRWDIDLLMEINNALRWDNDHQRRLDKSLDTGCFRSIREGYLIIQTVEVDS